MATLEQCEAAMHELAARMQAKDPADRRTDFDRRLSCTIRDLHAIFNGHLHDGVLDDIRQVDKADGQVRLELTSNDLLAMVDGTLNLGAAWAGGRVKVHAGVRDLMRLRTIF